eukprot:CAMPEP_0119375280 /NCGR_PEP_ID=MMETSP1334-20130426/34784_1 /TAXON_ID=127549 /ORGANISM="Calcidiscus leptoporus, Strain RCC1130" /LENGTH=70 /DNA_ID=CAMNT_0007393535 /DNA_START=310 /DNA_END=522 /DNA_ORIENTATION=-
MPDQRTFGGAATARLPGCTCAARGRLVPQEAVPPEGGGLQFDSRAAARRSVSRGPSRGSRSVSRGPQRRS